MAALTDLASPWRGTARTLAVSVAVAALVAACTGGSDAGGEADPGPVEADAEQVDGSLERVQDIWVYDAISTVDGDGAVVDLTAAIVATADGLDDPTDVAGGATFRAWPALDAHIVDGPTGQRRDDVEVVGGLVDDGDGEAVMVAAVPETAETPPIDEDDEVYLDLTAIEDQLTPGDPLVYDFVFARSHGPEDASGIELLNQRAEAGRLDVVGDPATGEPTVVRDLGEAREGSVYGANPAKATPFLDGLKRAALGCLTSAGTGCAGKFLAGESAGAIVAGKDVMRQICVGEDCDDPEPDPVPEPEPDPEPQPEPEPEPEPQPGDPDDDDGGGGGGGGGGRGFNVSDPVAEAPCVANCAEPTKRCWVFCGGGWGTGGSTTGEPHVATFDGRRFEMQSVGEFVMADGEDWTTHVRFVPYGDAGLVSVVGAVASRFDDVVVEVTLPEPYAPVVTVDGEELDLDEGTVEVGDLLVRSWRSVVQVAHPDIGMLDVGFGQRLDVGVHPASTDAAFVGLLGDRDGDPADDVRLGPDGDVLSDPVAPEDIHGPFADAWRVSDETSLFSYASGESTETFTDRDHPVAPAADAVEASGRRAQAATLCEIAGVDGERLEGCIVDYALTGEVSWVGDASRAEAAQRLFAGDDGETAEGIVWAGRAAGFAALYPPLVLDDLLVVAGTAADGDDIEVAAVDRSTGAEVWRTGGAMRCPPVAAAGHVVVAAPAGSPLTSADVEALVALDLETGEPVEGLVARSEDGEVPRIESCSAMASVGDVVVHNDLSRLAGFDGADLAPRWAADLGDHALAGPAADPSNDDRFWVVARDGAGSRAELRSAADGSVLASAALTGRPPALDAIEVLDDGAALVLVDGDDGTTLVRVDVDGQVAEVAEVDDGVEFFAVDGDVAYVYDGEAVVAYGMDDGAERWRRTTTSFDNNGGRIAVVDGVAVVAPFGGAYLEGHDANGARFAIEPDAVFGDGTVPAGVLDLSAADGVVYALGASGGDTTVVALAAG